MPVTAASFEVRSATPERVCAGVKNALRDFGQATAVMIFCTGRLATLLPALAEQLRACGIRLPMVIVSGPGVLSERGELDNESAATGMIWSGGRAEIRSLPDATELGVGVLAELLEDRKDGFAPSMLFIRSEGFRPDILWQLRSAVQNPYVFGAGTHGLPGIICLSDGRAWSTPAAVLALAGHSLPLIGTAHSCKLLEAPEPITKCRGALVEQIGGQPALDVLRRLGGQLEGQPLLFTVFAHESVENGGYELLVRGIQGIDPERRALMVSDDVAPGTLITFAARDATAAKQDMRVTCRRLAREARGTSACFALFFNCSGRGRSLHSQAHVDVRLIRERFPNLPIAGFQSAFEIGPYAGAPAMQLYTGILALFGAPS